MREVVILLLVVVLAIMVLGAVNQDQQLDFDYVVGTWEDVSLLELTAVAAGVVFAAGVVSAAIVRGGLIGGRRKLERELQETYVRLRAAEAKLAAAEPGAAVAASDVVPGEAVDAAAELSAPADSAGSAEPPPPAEELTVIAEPVPDEELTVVTESVPAEEATVVMPPVPAEEQTVVAEPSSEAGNAAEEEPPPEAPSSRLPG